MGIIMFKTKFGKILYIICFIAVIAAGAFAAKTRHTLDKITGSANNGVSLSDVDLSGIKVTTDSKIINVLIVGNDFREGVGYSETGCPDSMLIGTLDTKHGMLKLTSLMRDQIVNIPGHEGMNKLNSVYGYEDGGVKLLYKTIAENFGIKLDGYVELNFKAVREVVDAVGGIDIELTQSEADYLNTTNYIRKKEYRNVKAGKQTLNGWQAMGYSRIRKTVYTPNGLTDDWGRTWRQRNVINAVFNKAKKMPISRLTKIAERMMSKYVTTDLKSDDIIGYMKDVIFMGTTKIHSCQIPVNGTIQIDQHYTNSAGTYIGDVLIPDLDQNKEALHEFIFKYSDKDHDYEYQPKSTSSASSTETTQ